ncbi:phage protease [Pleomorphomonas koreensis]|uniref:phage protease n=1 Tax=Pleomorphomonas koreensis TaxID=257440 RepID=UPI0003F8660F|nr:phage protease [Pleomorphomonas koreensis]
MLNIASTRSKLLASAFVVELGDSAQPWVQMMPAGTFTGRDGRGPFIAGNKARIERIAEATRRYHGATEMVIDYEHQTLKAAESGKPAPAAGWVKEIEARDDGLYGRVEWTANAAAAIAAKEYRYLSPVLFHTADGHVLGLNMASLTNVPNLQMAEVSAHAAEIFQPAEDQDPMLAKLKKLLGLPEDATDDAVFTAAHSLATGVSAMAVLVGKPEGTPIGDITAAMTSAMAAAKPTEPDPTKFVPVAQVSALQADLNTLKANIAKSAAETDVDEAIKAGKIVPALRDWAISLHTADTSAFKAFVSNAPVLTSAQVRGNKPTGGEPDLSDSDVTAMRALGLSKEEFLKAKASEKEQG